MAQKTRLVWGSITEDERKLVEKLCKIYGMRISEFVRFLVIRELERHNLISTKIEKIKEELKNG